MGTKSSMSESVFPRFDQYQGGVGVYNSKHNNFICGDVFFLVFVFFSQNFLGKTGQKFLFSWQSSPMPLVLIAMALETCGSCKGL